MDTTLGLRALTREAERVDPCPTYVSGQQVRILAGLLAGLKGLVLREASKTRVIISISLLQRSVVAEVDLSSTYINDAASTRDRSTSTCLVDFPGGTQTPTIVQEPTVESTFRGTVQVRGGFIDL